MITIDESLVKFQTFKSEFENLKKSDITETDTRSKILDRLLIDVLGWEDKNIDREGHTKVGYYDYQIKCLSKDFTFVVEAKKTLIDFALPTRNQQVQINTLITSYNNKEVIEQIRSYIKELELQYGVISNGHQFIIGKFYGQDYQKNKCLIFNGFDDIENRFIEFYNALSKKSVLENNGFKVEEIRDFEPKTIFSSIIENNQEVSIRNTLRPEIQNIIDYVFDEIHKYEDLEDKEVIIQCFVKNEDTKSHQNAIQRLFADHTPKISGVATPKTDSAFTQIQSDIVDFPKSGKNINPPKPIILIGTKGAGKTTFIHYFFKVHLQEELQRHNPFIYLDFKKYIDVDLSQIISNVYNDLINHLLEFYEFLTEPDVIKRIYSKEIKQKEKTWNLVPNEFNNKLADFIEQTDKDKQNHFAKISEYLIKDRQTRLSVVIDNADQLDEKYQKQAYLLAQHFNQKAFCAVIIALREGYYFKYRNELPFNAFGGDKIFHISAPPYKEILQKRINYTLTKLKKFNTSQGIIENFKFIVTPEKITNFFQNLDTTLFSENSEMLKYLEQTSQNDIREGLRSFRYFLESGHTKLEEYILRENKDSSKPIPMHEFIKSIGLDNKLYYNHEISRIYNLFYPEADSKSHFTKIRILKYLFEKTKKGGYAEKFILCSEILQFFENFGYENNIILKEINSLLKNNLVETQDATSDIGIKDDVLNFNTNISISSSGYYYLQELICRLHYIDLVLQDTPIFSKEHYEKIKSHFPYYHKTNDGSMTRSLEERKRVVEIFLDYLRGEEDKELSNSLSLSSEEKVIFQESIVDYILNEKLNKELNRLGRIINNKYNASI